MDAEVTGQPLYVPDVQVGYGLFNALFVATQNNTVYALNADQPGSAPLWKVNLGPAVPTGYAGVCPAEPMGVLSTPVIDAQAGVLYVVAAHPVTGQPVCVEFVEWRAGEGWVGDDLGVGPRDGDGFGERRCDDE